MARMTGYTSMRDINDAPATDIVPERLSRHDPVISPVDEEYRSYTKKGNLDPGMKEHIGMINQIAGQIESGLVSRDGVENLARLNPRVSPILKAAYSSYLSKQTQNQEVQGILGQHFTKAAPAVPEKQYTEQDIGSGVGPMRLGEGIYGTGKPAVPAMRNYQGAVDALAPKYPEVAEKYKKLGGLDKDGSQFAKINPKEFTPESIREFTTTGDFSKLVPRVDAGAELERSDKSFTQEAKLRDEFRNLSKEFIDVRNAHGRIQESSKDPSPAGDLALIFNYMKMLDPGSTVREGEFATAQNSAGIPDRIRASYNRAMNGERLADTQRADFVKRADMLFKRQSTTHKKLSDQYRSLSKRYGVSGERVVTDYTPDEPVLPPNTAPTAETKVIGGKTYIRKDGKWFEQ